MSTELNYNYNQVKPILDRFTTHINSLSEAQKLAKINSVKKGHSRAFEFEIESKYKLQIFAHGITLLRDGQHIHSSNAKFTHLTTLLKKSDKRFFQ